MRLDEYRLSSCIDSVIDFTAVLCKEEIRTTGKGKPYLEALAMCGVVTKIVKFWDLPMLSGLVGKVVSIQAKVTEYNNEPSLNGLKIVDSHQPDKESYLYGDRYRHDTLSRFSTLLTQFEDAKGIYALITKSVLDSLYADFILSPAAKSFHHNYTGGLVQHTVEVVDMALKMCKSDLVLAGALLHDVGKVHELSINSESGAISYTALGSMLGHHSIGCSIVDETYFGMFGGDPFNKELMLLKHIILSHHGTIEMGSAVEPACLEAYVVHQADALSCRTYKQNKAVAEIESGECAVSFEMGKLAKYYKV